MTTESKPKLSLEEKAQILKENGISVLGTHKGNISGYNPPLIYIQGDENEGRRAVEILFDNGVPVFRLKQVWRYEMKRLPTHEPVWDVEVYF